MIDLHGLKTIARRLRGKSPNELLALSKKRASFGGYRILNLLRERRHLGWLPTEEDLISFLTRADQRRFNNLDKIFSLWENRFKNSLLLISDKDFKMFFEEHFPREQEQILDAALKISEGRISLFRSYEVEVGPGIDWHSTIINEKRWPLIYFRNINLRQSFKIGDLRTTWELNRHLHWVTLGKAYFLSEKPQYFKTFWHQFESWTQANPYLLGVNWLSAMEVAIRLNHWLAAYTLFCDCPYFDKMAKSAFWRWVYLHIHFLRYHFTSDDRGFRNNHLIIEAASLYIAGVLLSEFKDSVVWRNKSARVLREELRLQFLKDGFHNELCSSYHLQVTEAYLLAAVLGERLGFLSAKKWQQDIHKLVMALCIIAKPDGNLPMLGDGDDGTFLGLAVDRKQLNLKAVAQIASKWFEKNKIPTFGKDLSEGASWFVGFGRLPSSDREQEEKYVLETAQFAIFKDMSSNEYNYCLFSAGIKEPFHNYGHRHADLMSIVLSLWGHDVFIDPGTYCYNGPLKWRRFFQSTGSHNTILLNNRDQFDFGQHFGINRINYRSNLRIWKNHAPTIFGGKYVDRGRGAWHYRHIIFLLPHFIMIHDCCGEKGGSSAKLNYVLGPTVSVHDDKSHLICNISDRIQFEIDIYAGEKRFEEIGQIEDGWYSPSYWVKEKCCFLTACSKTFPTFFTTIITLSGKKSCYTRNFFTSGVSMEERICITIPDGSSSFTFFNTVPKPAEEAMTFNGNEFSFAYPDLIKEDHIL